MNEALKLSRKKYPFQLRHGEKNPGFLMSHPGRGMTEFLLNNGLRNNPLASPGRISHPHICPTCPETKTSEKPQRLELPLQHEDVPHGLLVPLLLWWLGCQGWHSQHCLQPGWMSGDDDFIQDDPGGKTTWYSNLV